MPAGRASKLSSKEEFSSALRTIPEIDPRIPLVVDLDGTLFLTDTLVESFVSLLFRSPLAAAFSLLFLAKGRAAFKRHLAGRSPPQAQGLPRRLELIELLQREKARGREIHLVTAADQKVADLAAAAVGLFDSAAGSDGRSNLKGARKLDYLRGRFKNGFIYAGDAASDRPIFLASRAAILCDVSHATAAALTRAGTVILVQLRRNGNPLAQWVSALRVAQWSKNLFIFVPLVTGHAYGDPSSAAMAAIGFVILCVLTSGTYIINDLCDLAADRGHPAKLARPFASGDLPVAYGLIAAPLMIAGAVAAGFALSVPFAATLLAYFLLSTLYSLRLKQLPLLDVLVIAVLLSLRIVMGAELIRLAHSPWLLSFSLAFFMSLASAKRHMEVMSAARAGSGSVGGRGYRGEDWPLTLTFGVGAGLVSIVVMLLYMTNDAASSGLYGRPGWLYAIPILLWAWLMRIWLMSHRLELEHDPVNFALTDLPSLGAGAAVVLIFLLSL